MYIPLLYILAPLVKIKQAITSLKKEITTMDIRMGVVEHILLQAKLKDKTSQNKQVHATAAPASYWFDNLNTVGQNDLITQGDRIAWCMLGWYAHWDDFVFKSSVKGYSI